MERGPSKKKVGFLLKYLYSSLFLEERLIWTLKEHSMQKKGTPNSTSVPYSYFMQPDLSGKGSSKHAPLFKSGHMPSILGGYLPSKLEPVWVFKRGLS